MTLEMIYLFGAVFLASILQTLTGFGFALVAAPLLTLLLGPKVAVMFILFTGIFIKALMVFKTWKQGSFARIFLLFAASIMGAFLGAHVLNAVSDSLLKICIGSILISTALILHVNITVKIQHHRLAKLVIGFISGVLGATTSLNGPPLVLYMINTQQDKDMMRADLARYFLLGNSATLIISYNMGNVHLESLFSSTLIAIPAILIGWLLGEHLFTRVSPRLFRRLSLAVIILSSLATVLSGLWPIAKNLLAHL